MQTCKSSCTSSGLTEVRAHASSHFGFGGTAGDVCEAKLPLFLELEPSFGLKRPPRKGMMGNVMPGLDRQKGYKKKGLEIVEISNWRISREVFEALCWSACAQRSVGVRGELQDRKAESNAQDVGK